MANFLGAARSCLCGTSAKLASPSQIRPVRMVQIWLKSNLTGTTVPHLMQKYFQMQSVVLNAKWKKKKKFLKLSKIFVVSQLQQQHEINSEL